MLDGLRRQHATLVILEFAIELMGQLARSSDHYVERLLGVARAWQAEEEAHRTGAEMVDVVQVEDARLDRVGHREQHFAVAGHALVTVEDVHFAKAQTALENVLQQGRAAEAVSSREITLITSTSSAGGSSLTLLLDELEEKPLVRLLSVS